MKNLKTKNPTSKGITLIALVITIIVMLILAAVSITMAVNGGLFNYAGTASAETTKERDKEQLMVSLKGWDIEKWTGRKTLVEVLAEDFGAQNVVDNGDGTVTVTMQNGNEYLVDEAGNISEAGGEEVVTSYLGKYVYYNGTKFIVYSEEEDILTLTPLTFDNDYLLSGKYTIDANENEKSVAVDYNGSETVYTDETYEEFSERIIGELNRECQRLFGTVDGTTIVAVNAETDFFRERILESVVSNINATEINDEVLATLDKAIEQYKAKYDITSSEMEQMLQNKTISTVTVTLINYYLNMRLSAENYSQMVDTLYSLNQGQITLDQIPEAQQQLFSAMMRLSKLYCFEYLQTFWISCVGYSETSGNFEVVFSDPLDGDFYVHLYNANSIAYSDSTCSLAPVLTLNKNLLRHTSGNNYEINV